jgi:hypothetical protein
VKATEILELFQQKKNLKADQRLKEEKQKFLEIEKRVLASLSPAKREKIKIVRKFLLKNR